MEKNCKRLKHTYSRRSDDARSEGVEKDYLISPISLKDLVLKELADCARDMPGSQYDCRSQNPDYQILADSKWCGFYS